jgi:hypothetical protein
MIRLALLILAVALVVGFIRAVGRGSFGRGMFRLWVVVSVLWVPWIGHVAIEHAPQPPPEWHLVVSYLWHDFIAQLPVGTYSPDQVDDMLAARPLPPGFSDDPAAISSVALPDVPTTARWYVQETHIAVEVPGALLAAGLVVAWIGQGFRSRPRA